MKKIKLIKETMFLLLMFSFITFLSVPVYASISEPLTTKGIINTDPIVKQATSSSKTKKAKAAYAKYLNGHRSSAKYFQLLTVKGSDIPVLVTSSSVFKADGKNVSYQYSIYLYKNGKVSRLEKFNNTSTSCILKVNNKYIGASYRLGMRVLHIKNGYLVGDVTYLNRYSGQYYYKYFSKYTCASHNTWIESGKMTKISNKRNDEINGSFYSDGGKYSVNFLKNTATNVKKKC